MLLAEIDLIRDSPVIVLATFGVFFGAVFMVGALDRKCRVDQPLFQFVLMQAVFVPVAAWMTAWCFQHPERLNIPDGWQYDMRIFGPVYGLVDIGLIVWFIRRRWWGRGMKAKRLMESANRLLAEGRIAEADAAYAEGRWLLDHECKRK